MPGLLPSRATLMLKPVGSRCNLDCHYCYYLDVQDQLYGGRCRRMGLDDLESILAGWLPRAQQHAIIAWQGGEPTLAGLDFFRKAMHLIERHRRPGQHIAHCLQTNGTTLDQAWCDFLAQHHFLVGISVDGQPEDHDHYRRDLHGQGSYARVMHGLDLLRMHHVDHNILCVVNDRNVQHPRRVYRELLRLGERWLQFIPAIEWVDADTGRPHDGYSTPAAPVLAPYSPKPAALGTFYREVFDQWFTHDRHKVSVRFFDGILSELVGQPAVECTHGPACHSQVTIEHNGDVFGCDHYVQRRWQLGSVRDASPRREESDHHAQGFVALTVRGSHATTGEVRLNDGWFDSLDHDRLGVFADRKLNLPQACGGCRWRRFCHGGCPKHRPHRGDLPEPTVLCEGYRAFFEHSIERFMWLASYVRKQQSPPPPGHAMSYEKLTSCAAQPSPVKPARQRPFKSRKQKK